MHSTASPAPGAPQPKKRLTDRFYHWLDRRTGIDGLLREALDEPIPGGAKYAYVFGSALLFVFLSQVITGVFLAMYYVPSADHAHTTVAYITKVVTGGSFLRSIHVYGASALMILLVLHMSQVFFYGAYKRRRELLWMSGAVLFLLMLSMAFTGYLLPWDQRAYFATTVGTNLIGLVPWIGPQLKEALLGGDSMGTLTLSRFFVIHVFLLPAAIFGFVAVHIYLFRKAGAAGPAKGDPEKIRQKTEPFYPRQVMKDIVFVTLVIVTIGLVAYYRPADLGPRADPANTQYLPRPEWYYRPFFEWLKFWQGRMEVIGVMVVPIVGLAVFFLWPFLDRNPERAPRRRPAAITAMVLTLLLVGGLGDLSYRQDAMDPSVAKELSLQQEMDVRYMAAPFQVEMIGSIPAKTPAANPEVAQGKKVFEDQGCSTCHGEGAVGTAIAPKLIGVVKKFGGADKVAAIIHSPPPAFSKAGMPSFNLTEAQRKSLIAYLESLH
jgi:quinol-cytochrome oxidoreductase complex cytochrome b subunit